MVSHRLKKFAKLSIAITRASLQIIESQRRFQRRRWYRNETFEGRKQGNLPGFFFTVHQRLRTDQSNLFHKIYRMSLAKFDQLLELVTPKLHRMLESRQPLERLYSTEEMLAVTLHYLFHEMTMSYLSVNWLIPYATLERRIIPSVLVAIVEVLRSLAFPPLTKEFFVRKAEEFLRLWQLPNCVGAVDGKYIRVQKFPGVGSGCHNHKSFESLVLLAVCDAFYRFIFVDVGAYGGSNDSAIFQTTDFYKKIASGEIQLPEDQPLPGTTEPSIPFFLVGDAAFQHLRWLQKGYPLRQIKKLDNETMQKLVLNYRVSRGRRPVENGFGVLSARCRRFRTMIVGSEEFVVLLVMAACSIHNFLMFDGRDDVIADAHYCPPGFADVVNADTGDLTLGEWREDMTPSTSSIRPVKKFANEARRNRSEARSAIRDREALKRWFNTGIGAKMAPWQQNYVLKGQNTERLLAAGEAGGDAASQNDVTSDENDNVDDACYDE